MDRPLGELVLWMEWCGAGGGAPSADRVSEGCGRIGQAVAVAASLVWVVVAGGARGWPYRSAVARRLAGWGVHAACLLAGPSDRQLQGRCCLAGRPDPGVLGAG